MACTVHHFGNVAIVECTRGGKARPGCPWPLTGRLAAVVSPVVRSIEELRAKLRREVEACDIVIAALGGEP